MATTFTWAIANLERETSDGFVFTGHYTVSAADEAYSAADEAYSAGAYGSVGFERPENLIPYDDLTQDMVVGWVKDQLGEEKVTQIEEALQAQLDEKRAPTKQSGTPW